MRAYTSCRRVLEESSVDLYWQIMEIVHLSAFDIDAYRALRDEGLTGDPEAFRYTVLDDARIEVQTWRDRLERDFVIAARHEGRWLGTGGLTRVFGEKLDHKGLVWGMYVRPESRGHGVADAVMAALIEHGQGRFRLLQLTVMADNGRARAFYERHGFRVYGIEPQAVRQGSEFRDEAFMWLPLEVD